MGPAKSAPVSLPPLALQNPCLLLLTNQNGSGCIDLLERECSLCSNTHTHTHTHTHTEKWEGRSRVNAWNSNARAGRTAFPLHPLFCLQPKDLVRRAAAKIVFTIFYMLRCVCKSLGCAARVRKCGIKSLVAPEEVACNLRCHPLAQLNCG